MTNSISQTILNLRLEYATAELRKSDLDPNPFRQFERWFQQTVETQIAEPNAMTLATATRDGAPAARMVLLKGFDERGFVFYTNCESQKGRELAGNPRAALVFYWGELHRQVRLTGMVCPVSREESEEYFRTRPAGAQLGAWASRQGAVLSSREVLERRMRELEAEYAGKEIPLPPNWGGYRLAPNVFEFWQGRVNRLHDRLRYTRQSDGTWAIERLSP